MLILSAAAPSFGAPAQASDGWRARGASAAPVAAPATRRSLFRPAQRPVRQVSWHDDVAGPALRIAQRETDEAFGDGLRDAFEQPFGVGDNQAETLAPPPGSDADTADQLFNDLPPAPAQPQPAFEETPDDQFMAPIDDQPFMEPGDDQPTFQPSDDFGPPTEPELIDPPAPDEDEAMSEEDRVIAAERAESSKDCAEDLAALKATRLDSIDLSIQVTGSEGEDFPFQCTLQDGEVFTPRSWGEITYTWKAAGLCHKPLYFQDVHLERYGHSWGPYVQPIVSGAHFFGRIPALPYMMGLQTPNECVYTLGHYRPGDCAPYLIDPVPFTWRAAIFQAGGTMGVIGILP